MGVTADIRATVIPVCIKDLGQSSTYIAWVSVLKKNVIFIHKIFYIIHQTYKEELCAGFWVTGFKVKADQDKSNLYLKRASSLVVTNSWPQEARGMIVGLGGHAGPWPLGAASPPLQPRWKAGQLAMFSTESELWIFMYNLLILVLATVCLPWRNVCLVLWPIFLIGSSIFLILNYRSCLHIFEISPLSVALISIIFSHFEGCLFTLLIVSFLVQKL